MITVTVVGRGVGGGTGGGSVLGVGVGAVTEAISNVDITFGVPKSGVVLPNIGSTQKRGFSI